MYRKGDGLCDIYPRLVAASLRVAGLVAALALLATAVGTCLTPLTQLTWLVLLLHSKVGLAIETRGVLALSLGLTLTLLVGVGLTVHTGVQVLSGYLLSNGLGLAGAACHVLGGLVGVFIETFHAEKREDCG
ncbi:hypothetical protein BC939DRAFT_470062 [Gamsiella multidivaricata]|uniref:uncharacterized protein n=1 Tax=Gamsiella multidivaricata TaxID=101098 RepID=UPI00221EFF1E|nr:uncharacterized protein BC939DRAFT_470062 [Gamsiella multidivaricata]KAI7816188.1 hypothetical protein BC939DRAFT_470062 [Gamsiella multidivaricata]